MIVCFSSSGKVFLNKISWLVETIFFHFFRRQSTYVSGKVHSLTGTYFSANPLFWLAKTSFLATGNSVDLFRVFSASKNYYSNLGEIKKRRKTKYISASEHQFFSIFSEILRFFKVEATFLYSGNAFFNRSFIRLVEKNFQSICFFIRAIFLLVAAIIGIRGK